MHALRTHRCSRTASQMRKISHEDSIRRCRRCSSRPLPMAHNSLSPWSHSRQVLGMFTHCAGDATTLLHPRTHTIRAYAPSSARSAICIFYGHQNCMEICHLRNIKGCVLEDWHDLEQFERTEYQSILHMLNEKKKYQKSELTVT